MGTATLTSVASICLASFLLIASTGQERKSSRPELRIRVEPDEVEVGKEVIVKLIFRTSRPNIFPNVRNCVMLKLN